MERYMTVEYKRTINGVEHKSGRVFNKRGDGKYNVEYYDTLHNKCRVCGKHSEEGGNCKEHYDGIFLNIEDVHVVDEKDLKIILELFKE